jgi:transposase-like protein
MICPNCKSKRIHKARKVPNYTLKKKVQRYICADCGITGYEEKFKSDDPLKYWE